MLKRSKEMEKALGNVNYNLTENTMKSREFSRSLFAMDDIKRGTSLDWTLIE